MSTARSPAPATARLRGSPPRSRWTLLRDAAGLLALVLGILFSIIVFLPVEGSVGGPLHESVGWLLGWTSWALPLTLLTVGLGVLVHSAAPAIAIPVDRLAGVALAVTAFIPARHLLGLDRSQSWARVTAHEGGGAVGHLLGNGLLDALGGPLTAALLSLAMFLGAVLALDLTLVQIARLLALLARWCFQRVRVASSVAWPFVAACLRFLGPLVRGGVHSARSNLLSNRSKSRQASLSASDFPTAGGRPISRPAYRGGDGWSNRAAGQPIKEETEQTHPRAVRKPVSALAAIEGGRTLATSPASAGSLDPVPRDPATWQRAEISLFRAQAPAAAGDGDLLWRSRVIEETLASFNIEARVVEAHRGPSITQFGVEPAAGVAVNRILSRQNDLALRLGTSPIRLEAPVPGKRIVGIEVPNSAVSTVTFRDVVESPDWERANGKLRLALGRDVSGTSIVGDLGRMPHLLIAGATGAGKSVCINTIVGSLLYQYTPAQLQLVMIDPKRVELTGYALVPHLRLPVVTDMDKVVGALKWVVLEMERRYTLFAQHAVRNLDGYNRWAEGAARADEPALPFLVVIVDELADMMLTAADDVEKTLCRLAQLARATGIHLIVATQRPSVDVLTGLIKANFPTRIAFAVSSQIDSRVILDQAGAEKLLGRGDALFMPTDAMKPVRLQGALITDEEIGDLVSHWQRQGRPRYSEEDIALVESLGSGEDDDEETYERACELAETVGKVSASLLSRRLGVGRDRAQRLLERLVDDGIAEA